MVENQGQRVYIHLFYYIRKEITVVNEKSKTSYLLHFLNSNKRANCCFNLLYNND